VRGRGLWLALLLASPVAPAVEAAARDAGFLVNTVAPGTIRLAPPLVLTEEEAARFVAALPSILDAASHDAAGQAADGTAAEQAAPARVGT